MGREIRRVPPGWQHPKRPDGHYQPMLDKPYERALQEWINLRAAWDARDVVRYRKLGGFIPQGEEEKTFQEEAFEAWEGRAPNPDYYRPAYDAEPTCYQMYETVSEGTPVSPVFATEGELAEWLVEQGHSEDAAAKFIECGWAPSMILCRTADKVEIHQNIDALVACTKEPEGSQ